MKTERMFPIQGEHFNDERVRRPAGQVPWGIAELAYKQYVKDCGKGQSLERLAERGGFGWSELIRLLRGGYFSDERIPPGGSDERESITP